MVVKEFPLYIDCTGPFNKDDYQLEYLFSNYWGEWQGEYTKYISEDWFYDCAEDYFLEYVPEEGGWLGGRYSVVYMNDALRTPGWHKKYGMVEGGRFTFSSEKQRFISTSFDYAGNVSALMIESGDSFQECIDLTIDTKTLGIGETATLKNVAENDVFTPIVRWTGV